MLLVVLVLSGAFLRAAGEGQAHDLFGFNSGASSLSRLFPDPDVSYLLLDLRDHRVLASQWGESDKPVPIGSLVKPFTALAYAQSHQFKFPEYVCDPGSCWLPRGHGHLDISHAIAVSCNSYFGALASHVAPAHVAAVAQQFGLQGPDAKASPDVLTGKFGMWRESPSAVARAYAELLLRRSQPGVREIVAGMALSAEQGTAAGISHISPHSHVLAKTGTAPCTHQQRAPGDGFAVMAWPAEFPRYLVLVRKHGVPGSAAAAFTGQMLQVLEGQP